MTIFACDLSNYTSDLSVGSLEAWKADGITHAIVQSIDPPAGYPEGKTRGQIAFLLDHGFTVDAYLWLWFGLSIEDIHAKLALLDGLPVRRLWLDVEDPAAENYDQASTEAKVALALLECDAWAAQRGMPKTGLYTGWWFWTDLRYMANTARFSDRDLWDANYDGVPDATAGFKPYGGWSSCAIKQYWGTMGLHEVWGIDLNALSPEEETKIAGSGGTDSGGTDMDCQAYKDAIERAVNRLQIELERKTAAGKTATLRRTIISEIQGELFQAFQT